jgi:hypothetical protein
MPQYRYTDTLVSQQANQGCFFPVSWRSAASYIHSLYLSHLLSAMPYSAILLMRAEILSKLSVSGR